MKEFLEKISSYNFFNYLLPGVVFSYIVDKTTRYELLQSDIVVGFFIYYFCGLMVSRLGSLVLQPIFEKVKFVCPAPYPLYVEASKQDDKVELFSEINNSYRTWAGLFLSIMVVKIFELLGRFIQFFYSYEKWFFAILLFLLFLFSYRKQTNYVRLRVEAILKMKKEG